MSIRKSELAGQIDAYRAAGQRPIELAWALSGISGLAAGAVLIQLTDTFGWPRVLEPIFFFSGWAVMLTALFIVLRRSKRRRAAHQVHCPSCSKPLLNRDGGGWWRLAAEHVTLTGHCPYCDAAIAE